MTSTSGDAYPTLLIIALRYHDDWTSMQHPCHLWDTALIVESYKCAGAGRGLGG
jgi:hypothetical protein